jgi:hypothetical protein
MKSWKIITLATISVVAAALLVSTAAAMGPFGFNPITGASGYGGRGGMMGGYGYGYGASGYTAPNNVGAQTSYYQTVYPFQFGGCMGGFGWNNGYNYASNVYTGQEIDLTTAETIAQSYVASINNPDLTVTHVEEYQYNFYVQVNEQSTGNGAFELLINKYTGSIYPEMGPNMMWNTKYGMMRGGALGGIFGTTTATMTVTAIQAQTIAQQYLDTYIPGTTTGDVAIFYGYYTIEILNGTTPYGMLSVNGYNGYVWFHTWHGAFIAELEVD